MQVQISLTFDPTDEADMIGRLESILSRVSRTPEPVGKPAPVPGPTPPPDQAKAQTQDQAKAQRMANARAAKTSKQAQNQPAPVDLSAPINGLDDPDDDPLGLNPSATSMSPAEALEEGLSLVRQAYYAGHTAEVKTLQQEFNVATFKDVPVTAGHQLYASAMKMAQHVGLRP